YATRELSRHLRWLDLIARELGFPPSKLELPEDQATQRFAVWRRFRTRADVKRVFDEVKLPGPLRPRSMPDAMVMKLLEQPMPTLELPADALEAAAVVHSFPGWLAQAIALAAGEAEAPAVLEALNREPPLVFRVRPPGARASVMESLKKRGILTAALDESA